MFAKALFQTTNLLRLYGPFREQVCSYVWAWEPDGFCRSELVREGIVSNDESSAPVRALSRTSSLLRLGMRTGLCRSELVREGFVLNAKSSATVRALSRTSSLLRLGMGAGWLL
ncbi:hypothetical protein Psyr_4745 [Pseudomonas syringae pv. syringae B728a]|uniref:Uncharacterized protein n=1 Tax=Pseudomonas syringae pv. syringae (strain B728a) TaxID=205918 RepID=Q4ZM50_PSEU2|nr:hypothetical protein Psyr_4745 [Pseudomonas syringae pv. syringae B728a]MCF5214537.1 hypothetical protein [Pseudomonas syringae]MCF5263786.1 hypothetical protein [Pseudomonas syringae]MCF5303563.1 hypothetical protein [Pseudomonas syringae]